MSETESRWAEYPYEAESGEVGRLLRKLVVKGVIAALVLWAASELGQRIFLG